MNDALGTEIVKEKSVVGGDKNFTQRCRIYHINLGQTFFDDGPLARVGAVEAGDEHLTRITIKRADAVFADENTG